MATVRPRSPRPVIQITTKTPPTQYENRLQRGSTRHLAVDVAGLEAELRGALKGEVRFGAGDRGLYASDAGNYRMVPIGVVLPRCTDDVLHTLAACRKYGAPVVARGGGTGIPGQTVNVAVVLDFSKYMNEILELNAEQKYARIQPGIVLDEL